MNERWTLDTLAQPACRHWDGETVAHHALSNDTHRLAEPADWILDRLGAEGALAVDDIAVGSPFDAAELVPALEALRELGFVIRC